MTDNSTKPPMHSVSLFRRAIKWMRDRAFGGASLDYPRTPPLDVEEMADYCAAALCVVEAALALVSLEEGPEQHLAHKRYIAALSKWEN